MLLFALWLIYTFLEDTNLLAQTTQSSARIWLQKDISTRGIWTRNKRNNSLNYELSWDALLIATLRETLISHLGNV